MNPSSSETDVRSAARPSLEELQACARTLAALVGVAEAFLDDKYDAALVRVRAEANRLIAGIRAASKRRKKEAGRRKREERKAHDRAIYAAAGIRILRSQETPAHPPLPICSPPPALIKPRHCYICKAAYIRMHPFYDAMCPPCGEFNLRKRNQTADLSGMTAVVTGGRIKIGYRTALKLLRAGARTIVSTRFPRDAARRYAAEPDFDAWRNRLTIHGLDLRHLGGVHRFADTIRASEPALHILINNAAQTVRRPASYYSELAKRESEPCDGGIPPGLVAPIDHHIARRLPAVGLAPANTSAQLSQIALLEEDLAALPIRDGEPFDARPRNSWIMGVGDVSTPELVEVHLVNALSPFILIHRLLPLLVASGPAPRYVVNVSAMEGKFQEHSKRPAHPHTNMAKAALNMLTRTSARELVQYGIYMNSVDTGWVTNEFPYPKACRMESDRAFQPPLDEEDGAARVLDPVFEGIRTGRPPFGLFFKDYNPTEW